MIMRDNLYRGKRYEIGEWVEGDLVRFGIDCSIVPFFGVSTIEPQDNKTCDRRISLQAYAVDFETICQYSELTDKNKTKIFENDIVKDIDSGCIGIVKFGLYDGKHYGFYIEWVTNSELRKDIYFWTTKRSIEVIGNVFDDVGLLKEI